MGNIGSQCGPYLGSPETSSECRSGGSFAAELMLWAVIARNRTFRLTCRSTNILFALCKLVAKSQIFTAVIGDVEELFKIELPISVLVLGTDVSQAATIKIRDQSHCTK